MQPEQEQHGRRPKDVASYAMALAMFSLAAALVYFTWQIGIVSQQIPDILASVENTSARIEPVVKQVGEIKEMVSPIVTEVSEIRKQVPLVLQEVQAVRQHIPAVLSTTNNAVKVIDSAVTEVKEIRPLVPRVLDEVKQTRELIPTALDRADKLVTNAKEAGKEASKGAVTGMLTGIITAPFEMMGSLGKKMFALSDESAQQLTETDIEIATAAVQLVASKDVINYSTSWNNPDSDANGTVTLIKTDDIDGRPCKIIHSTVRKLKKAIIDKNFTICSNENNEWELKE